MELPTIADTNPTMVIRGYTDGGEQVNEKQVTTYTALPQASSCRLVDFKTLPVVCRGETYGLESLNSDPWPLPGHPEGMKMGYRQGYFHTRQGSSNGLREASFKCWSSAAPTRGLLMRRRSRYWSERSRSPRRSAGSRPIRLVKR